MLGAIHYPAGLMLAGKRVLVVGGGEVAARRVETLCAAGARVRVVAPRVSAGIAGDGVTIDRRAFTESDLDGATLALACTDDRTVNARVAAAARARGIWVNVADEPALCDFAVPAIARRGPIVVAISTSGESPALAARLRREIDPLLGDEHAAFARLAGAARRRLQAAGSTAGGTTEDRAARLRALVDSPLLERLREGDRAGCEAAVAAALGPEVTLADLEAASAHPTGCAASAHPTGCAASAHPTGCAGE
ncbi:MAG: bifunctional precorrin-2 dehydrogenase/sirohydrochlorin ferrochelatase [Myxococcota bacterium]